VCCRVVEGSVLSTCGPRATEATMTTATVTAMRPVCGPYQSTRPLMTDRLPAMMRAARRLLPRPSVTARVAIKTPEWYVGGYVYDVWLIFSNYKTTGYYSYSTSSWVKGGRILIFHIRHITSGRIRIFAGSDFSPATVD